MVIKSKTKKKIIIAVCIVLAVIIIFAIVGYFVLRYFIATARQPGEITANAVVQTDKGALQGRENNGVYNFLGVEYARATKLFQPAEQVEPWDGVKNATEYGSSSMQSNFWAISEHGFRGCNTITTARTSTYGRQKALKMHQSWYGCMALVSVRVLLRRDGLILPLIFGRKTGDALQKTFILLCNNPLPV